MAEIKIFISYCRTDAEIVGPLVQLLHLAEDSIFRDVDSIPPGSRWRAALTEAIDRCETFLLFWCSHSSRSEEVKKEYRQAITRQKTVVPVLLDDADLPEDLAVYQGIDLRTVLGNHEGAPKVRFRSRSGPAVAERQRDLLVPDKETLAQASLCLKDRLGRILDVNA
jgi:hypothetical protein